MKKYSDPIITKTALIIDLHEPLYASHFGIWDKWLKIVKEKDLNMIVKTPFGIATYTYATWMRGAVKKQRYYKNPQVPMIFWCRDTLPDIADRAKRKQQEKEQEGTMADFEAYAKRMVEIKKKLRLDKKVSVL